MSFSCYSHFIAWPWQGFFKVIVDQLKWKPIYDFLCRSNSNHMPQTCPFHVTGLFDVWPSCHSWRSIRIMTNKSSYVDEYMLQVSCWLNLPNLVLRSLFCYLDHARASRFAGCQIRIQGRRAKNATYVECPSLAAMYPKFEVNISVNHCRKELWIVPIKSE